MRGRFRDGFRAVACAAGSSLSGLTLIKPVKVGDTTEYFANQPFKPGGFRSGHFAVACDTGSGLSRFTDIMPVKVGDTTVYFANQPFKPGEPSWTSTCNCGFAVNAAQPGLDVRRCETAQGTKKALDGNYVWFMGPAVENDRVLQHDALKGQALQDAYKRAPWIKGDRVPLVFPQKMYDEINRSHASPFAMFGRVLRSFVTVSDKTEQASVESGAKAITVEDREDGGKTVQREVINLQCASLRVTKVKLKGNKWMEDSRIERISTIVLDDKVYEKGTLFWKGWAPVHGPKIDYFELGNIPGKMEKLKGKDIDELELELAGGEKVTVYGGDVPIRCPPGDAKLTSAGDLTNIRHGVIHAVGGRPAHYKISKSKNPNPTPEEKKDSFDKQLKELKDNTRVAYRKSLEVADKRLKQLLDDGVSKNDLHTSVAFPLLSAGYYAGDVPMKEVVTVAWEGISDYFVSKKNAGERSLITEVHIIITRESEAKALREVRPSFQV